MKNYNVFHESDVFWGSIVVVQLGPRSNSIEVVWQVIVLGHDLVWKFSYQIMTYNNYTNKYHIS